MQPNDNRPKMIDGVRRPTKPVTPREPDLRPDHDLPAPEPTPMLEAPDEPRLESGDLEGHAGLAEVQPKKRNVKKWLIVAGGVIVIALVAAFIAAFAWYQSQLAPVTDDTAKRVKVTIVSGTTPGMIAEQLETAGVIRSKVAFGIYTKLTGTENKLKAGAYSLQPSLPTPTIVSHLVDGKEDTFTVTFLPGDTLANNRKALIKAGFSEAEVDAALNKKYDRPLFATKPASADLEGYLYGETIEFALDASVDDVLDAFFGLFEKVITENNLIAGFRAQGLSLYEGITLASIVQREIPDAEDQKQVARVFFNRMEQGMNLGSDVTYQYAADKAGVARTPSLKSPYNTRIHAGLPPGPIAAPGKSALLAVANPAQNDYLFFLSGDDHKTYYGKTDADHQKNIVQHCQKKCLIL